MQLHDNASGKVVTCRCIRLAAALELLGRLAATSPSATTGRSSARAVPAALLLRAAGGRRRRPQARRRLRRRRGPPRPRPGPGRRAQSRGHGRCRPIAIATVALAALGAARRHRRHAVPGRHDADRARAPRARRPPARPPDAARRARRARPPDRRQPRSARRRLVEAWTQIEIDRTDDADRASSSRPSAGGRRRRAPGRRATSRRCATGWHALGARRPDPAVAGRRPVRVPRRRRLRPRTPTAAAAAGRERARPGSRRRTASIPPPMPPSRAVVIARTDDTSTVFRPRTADACVTVRPTDGADRVTGSSGCWRRTPTASASSTSLASGRRRRAALDLTEARIALPHRAGDAHRARDPAPRPRARARRRRRWPSSSTTSSASRSASWCGCSRCPSPSGRGSTVLVYLPRSRFTADAARARRRRRRRRLRRRAQRTFETFLGASSLARIAVSVRRPDREPAAPTSSVLGADDRRPVDLVGRPAPRRRWSAEVGEAQGRDAVRPRRRATRRRRTGPRCSRAGRSATSGASPRCSPASGDHDDRRSATTSTRPPGEWRFRVYRRGAAGRRCPSCCRCSTTSACRRSTSSRTRSAPASERVFVYDIGVRVPAGVELDDATARRPAARRSPRCRRRGRERRLQPPRAARRPDRARGRASCAPTASTCARSGSRSASRTSRRRWPPIRALVADLVELFHARFDPAASAAEARDRRGGRAAASASCAALDAIPSLDDDRICRMFLTLIDATVRTNYYRGRPAISFKFDPAAIPDLPLPRPQHEIWVCAPRVEGVHLRGGADRPRRPALERPAGGLPHRGARPDEGADGEERGHRADRRQGRLRRQAPAGRASSGLRGRGRRSATGRSSAACSTSPTTSSDGGASVHPPDTVVHDGDDTYLVVAADKGTATFSDIANEISARVRLLARRRVRLRWQRRVRPQGDGHHRPRRVGERAPPRQRARQGRRPRPAHRRSASATCRATCSATGCCARERLRLVAAFDHRHVFIDPDPGPGASLRRARSGCSSCPARAGPTTTRRCISAGGGVYPRTLKSIELSAEARARARRAGPAR